MKKIVFISLSLICLNIMACPLGAKEDHLTIQRIMRNFGKYSRDAESIVVQGLDNPTNVKEETLDKSISDLNIVIACSEAVISNPTGDLLPTMVHDLKDDELKNYTQKLVNYFMQFKNATVEFQRLLKVEKVKSIEQRNYRPAYVYDKEVFNSIIDEAHRELHESN